ncbi:MAG: hypothetical protein PHX72_02445 [Candidatus Shapirobacteria bacterium]|nr:hypothetical protein [Candidatus Shapirobacteria bacterium]
MTKINLTKKQKIILTVIALVVVTIGGFLLIRNRSQKTDQAGNLPIQIQPLTIDQLPIVSLTAKNSGRELTLAVKASQIPLGDKIEYELIYYLEDGLSRGAMGEIDLVGGRGERDILLGTCSRNVCRYDEGVTGGEVIISLAKDDQLHSFETKFAFLTSSAAYNDQNLEISTAKGSFIVLEGGGLPAMPDQEILAGPYVITAEAGSGLVDFKLTNQQTLLLFWNQESWEEVEEYEDLSLGTYLLVTP